MRVCIALVVCYLISLYSHHRLVFSAGGTSNESFSRCALQLLQDLSSRVQGMAEELSAVRDRVDGLPAHLSETMGALFAAQQEGLLEKMNAVAEESKNQLRKIEKANNASKLGAVVATVKAELQDWLAEVVVVAADGAAEKATAGMKEAACAQQTALFQQLSALEAMSTTLQSGAVSRADLSDMKTELSGLISTVNSNVCAVLDRLKALANSFDELFGAVEALRAEAGDHSAVLDVVVTQLQQCATSAAMTDLLTG